LRDIAKAKREVIKRTYQELQDKSKKAREIAIKVRKARTQAWDALKASRSKMRERTNKMRQMLIEARETARKETAGKKDLTALAKELITSTKNNFNKDADAINTTAANFCTAVAASYDATKYDEVKKHFTTSSSIARNLIEARKGIDFAYILAQRVRVLSWGELRKAQWALKMSVREKAKEEADKKAREEAQKLKPVKCPMYTRYV